LESYPGKRARLVLCAGEWISPTSQLELAKKKDSYKVNPL
jgi:hypothetical protein